ncbi:MAG: response regulator transcription factor [Synergistaceae bacterium]|jgi:two-component system nitrate/nitrite response regulator NarL|nr:response regulator transcription factor [Synergistaceae bacterium]
MSEQKENLKLFIMDDRDIFRAGLAEILRQEKEDFEVAGCGELSDETEEACIEAAPDVLVIHVSEREMENHLQIIDRIKSEAEGTRILVIVDFNDTDGLLKVAASGCDGYVHSEISGQGLMRIIQKLGNDVCIFDRTVIDKILHLEEERMDEERQAVHRQDFSPRERKIVEMLAEGKNSTTIGAELELSAGTVKNIISDMMKRHHFRKRTQLVKKLSP